MSPSDSTSRVSEFFSTIRIRKSISSLKSKSGSIKSNKSTHKRSSSYTPYAVYQQAMFPSILRDSDVSQKLIDAINDIPGGRRSVSRLARTCKSFCEPAMDVLWRELDSLVPIVGLFPSHLLKKSRRPGLGLVRGLTFVLHLDTYESLSLRLLLTRIGTESWNMESACAASPILNGPTTLPLRSSVSWKHARGVISFSPTSVNSPGGLRHRLAWLEARCS